MKRCRSGVMVHTSTCGKKKTPRANPERTWRCSALQNTNCRTNATRGKKDQRAKLTRPTARAGEAGTTAERFSSTKHITGAAGNGADRHVESQANTHGRTP